MSKRKLEKDQTIDINKNVISYASSCICIDNISFITIGRVPQCKLWILSLIFICLSAQGLDFTFGDDKKIVIMILIVSLLSFIGIIYYNCIRDYILNINLNSGLYLGFRCKNKDFLKIVLKKITDFMNGKYDDAKGINISFKECQIIGDVLKQATINRSVR